MKKILSFCLVLFMLASLLIMPTGVSAKEEMNVVFLGGSITEANSGYASRVGRWIKEYYPEKEVNVYNAGLGGTPSSVGLGRLGKDVLSYSPDLVFIEFAVNDTPYPASEVKEYMDGIVWTLQNQEKKPAIVFLYTTKREGNSFTDVGNVHQEIAAYYKIPSIDVGQALVDKVNSGTEWQKLLSDGVHPTTEGHKLYAETIIKAMEENPTRYFTPITPKTSPKIGSNKNLVYPTVLDIFSGRIKRSAGWGEGSHNGSASTVCNEWNALTTNKKGETLELEFYGSYFGLMYLMNESFGEVTYSIDGASPKVLSCQYGINYYQAVGALLEKSLGEGKHKVVITTNDMKGVRLLGIILDEGNNPLPEDSLDVIQSVKTIGGSKLNAGAISADTEGFMVRFGYPMDAASVRAGIRIVVNGSEVPAEITCSEQTAKVKLLSALPSSGRGTVTLDVKTNKGTAKSAVFHFEVDGTVTPYLLDSKGEYRNLPAGRELTVGIRPDGEYDGLLCVLRTQDGKVVATAYQENNGEKNVKINTPQNTEGLTLCAYIYAQGSMIEEDIYSVRISK